MTTWFPWGVFLVSLFLLVLLSGSKLLRKVKILRAGVLFLLAAVTGAALAEIVLGEWLAAAMRGIADLVGEWMGGMPASVFLAVVGFAMAAAIVIWLLDGTVDKREIAFLLILPTLFVAAGGGGITGEGSQLAAAFFGVGESLFSGVIGA